MRKFVWMLGLALAMPGWAKEVAQVPSELVATHGFVHVHAPKGGLVRMSVKPVGGGQGAVIDKPLGSSDRLAEEAFGYWLPAGRYHVIGWGNHRQDDGPVFEVQARRVTDLGGFVPVNVGGYELVLLPVRHAEDASALETAIAPFRTLLASTEPLRPQVANVPTAVAVSQPSSGLGLIADLLLAYDRKLNKPSTLQRLKDARDPAEFLRLARTVVPPLQDEPAIAPDGTAWFPADLGQLRRRSPQGQWDNLGIDTLRQILAVEYDNGRLVVGSDDGQLRASDDGGHAWKQLRSLGAGESVIDIDRVGTDGGTQWIQIGRPPYVINDVQMDAPDRGWASRWNANAFSGVWETYGYVPARKDWAKTGEAPPGCRPMRYATDAPVLCITTGASIFGLHEGKWEVEFSAN